MSFKTFRAQLKTEGEEGAFTAVFATLGVVDHDGDVTQVGAFKDGAEVVVGSWGHKYADLPVGRGVIRASVNEAAVEGKFFLDTASGRDTYQTVKNLGGLQEWSYIFSVLKQSFGEFEGRQVRFLEQLHVYSVDPVLAGAGIDTRTTAIKSRELSFQAHSAEIAELAEEYAARVKERVSLREKEGRMLSAANVERLRGIADSLKSSAGALDKLLADAEPEKSGALVAEFVRSQRIRARLLGVA